MAAKKFSQESYNSVGIDINSISVDAMSYVIPEIATPTTTMTLDGTEVITESCVLDAFAIVCTRASLNHQRGVRSADIVLTLGVNPEAVFLSLLLLRDHGYIEEHLIDGHYFYSPGRNAGDLMCKSLLAKDCELSKEVLIGFKNGETVVVDARTVAGERN